MGLSATPNAAAKDLTAMLAAGGNPPADKTQGTPSGADTFGNMLSDRLSQEAARRRADAQAASEDAAGRANAARKTAANAANGDTTANQGSEPADQGNAAAAPATAGTGAAPGTTATKATQAGDDQSAGTAAQPATDPAAMLAAQIEAARQAAQQATAPVSTTTAQSAAGANANANADSATQSTAVRPGTADTATLAALTAAAQGAADPVATAQTQAQTGQAALAKTAQTAQSAIARSAQLPDANALTQQMARTRAVAENTPPAARQLAGVATQGTNGEHASPLARRAEASTHGNPTQAATAAVADATSHASAGGHANAQADAQGGTGTNQFDGILTRATGQTGAAAPTFTAVGAGAAGNVAAAPVAPAQAQMLPTFGDAAWPHTMASQLAFMQVHRQSSAELQLNPGELGALHVKLEVDNGAVNASFVCQHQAVAELVQDAMPRLRDAMQQGGMQLAQTTVSTGDFSQQGASQGSSAQSHGGGNGGGGRFGAAQGQADTGTMAVAASRASTHDGVIDTFA